MAFVISHKTMGGPQNAVISRPGSQFFPPTAGASAAGIPPDVQDQGYTPLLEAARRGDSETALELIESGADVNTKDPYGVTALMFSLIAGSTDVALKLIEKGAEINSRDIDGRTALVEALTSENEIPPEIVEALVRKGAGVHLPLAG